MDYTIAPNVTAIGSGDTAPVTGTKGEFTSGNPATSTPATVLPGYQMNAIVEEIINVILGAGITLSNANNAQLFQAIMSKPGKNAQSFTSSSTFTIPDGVTRVRARVWGGGGGSGGTWATGSASLGGGGGGFAEGIYTVVPGNTYSVTVGAGGTAGTSSSSPGTGGNGGTSSFASSLSATGGQGGVGANASTAPGVSTGGSGTGGTIANITGEITSSPFAISGGIVVTSQGGSAPQGGSGGHFGSTSITSNGGPGTFPGGGAGGSAAQAVGGVGGGGLVILEW